MILKVHADRRLVGERDWLCPLLLPWANEFSAKSLWHDAVYAETGAQYFRLTSVEECDFVLWPALILWEKDLPPVVTAARGARAQGKSLVAFYWTDKESPLNIDNLILFTTSLRASLRGPNEFAMPSFAAHHLADPELKLALGERDKGAKPTVGFCGQLDTLADSRLGLQKVVGRAVYWGLLSRPRLDCVLRRMGISVTRSTGKRLRYQALGTVRRCHGIQDNFQLRDRHFDGINEIAQESQQAHRTRVLKNFALNVLGSDYTLCPRGGGNYSHRFYETLLLGRIPVFINSDCVLPYEDLVSWKDCCVWVEEEDIAGLPSAILNHYDHVTNEEFRALQRRCRQLWTDYLSLNGFFRHFHLHPGIRGLKG